MSSSSYYEQIVAAKNSLQLVATPKIGLVLGSGMQSVLDACDIKQRIAYSDIAGLSPATALSHTGELIVAQCNGVELLIANGRLHCYEGLSPQEVVKPIYLMRMCGIETLLISNAAGGLNESFQVADTMLIEDHINATGLNPLIGLNDERLGSIYPDMSQAYSKRLNEMWSAAAKQVQLKLTSGVYIGVTGPSLETSAERRFFRAAGADAVGMSTVLEVIAAKQCGLEVLGLSAITNMATGNSDQQVDTIDAVFAAALLVANNIAKTLPVFLRKLSAKN